MPDIILNTIFNNPALPSIPIYGFSDTFERPNGVGLGLTSAEAKAWEYIGTGTWKIDGGRAGLATAPSGVNYAVINANTHNGTLRTTVSEISNAAGGICARFTDAANLLRVAFRAGSGNNKLVLHNIVGGVSTQLGISGSGQNVVNGSVVELILNGNQVSMYLNGVLAIAPVASTVPYADKHGLYGDASDLGIRYADASFTPA